jgi:hypothetical protein
MKPDALPSNVEECHELIRRLQEENAHLRQAGSSFGQLAERLNQELRAERQTASGRPAFHSALR